MGASATASILYIERENPFRDSVSELLISRGYEVHAYNAPSCGHLHMNEKGRPDMVITDIGFERTIGFLRRLVKANIPAIILTKERAAAKFAIPGISIIRRDAELILSPDSPLVKAIDSILSGRGLPLGGASFDRAGLDDPATNHVSSPLQKWLRRQMNASLSGGFSSTAKDVLTGTIEAAQLRKELDANLRTDYLSKRELTDLYGRYLIARARMEGHIRTMPAKAQQASRAPAPRLLRTA